jgi:hypothetical protein
MAPRVRAWSTRSARQMAPAVPPAQTGGVRSSEVGWAVVVSTFCCGREEAHGWRSGGSSSTTSTRKDTNKDAACCTHTHTHTHWHTHAHTRAHPLIRLHASTPSAHTWHTRSRSQHTLANVEVPQLANTHIARAHTRTHTHTPSLHPFPVTQAPTMTNALLERFVIEQGGPERYHRLPYPRPLKRACALHLPRAYSFLPSHSTQSPDRRWRGKHMRGVQCGAATYIILVDHDLSVLFVTIVRHGALLNNPPGHTSSAPFTHGPSTVRTTRETCSTQVIFFFSPDFEKKGLLIGAKREC